MSKLKTFIEEMPKCELPVDIEGTLEPEMKFQIAKRNQIKLPYTETECQKYLYLANALKGQTGSMDTLPYAFIGVNRTRTKKRQWHIAFY